jgi:hypothetical protein
VRFDELRGNQPHVMAMCTELPGPVVRTATGFHANAEWWYMRHKGQQGTAREALPKHDVPAVIHPHDVKHLLGDVDAKCSHVLHHGLAYSWGMVVDDAATILAHRRLTGKRRVHFINLLSSLCRCCPVWHTCPMKTAMPANPDKNHRFPAEIISHAVWLYFRFCLSYRDVEALLFARGIIVTYEAIQKWCRTQGWPILCQ